MVWSIFTICYHLVFGYFWVHVPISQTTSQTTSVVQGNLLDPKGTPVQQIWSSCPQHTLYTLSGFYLYTFQFFFFHIWESFACLYVSDQLHAWCLWRQEERIRSS